MRRLRLARRELASLRSEKTIVLAILIQLFVAAFSSFLVVGLVSLYDPTSTAGAVGVEVGVSGNASDELAPVVDEGSRRAVRFDSRTAAVRAFQGREVDAVLHATELASGRVTVEALAPKGEFRTTLTVVELKDALAAFERERRGALAARLSRRPVPQPDAGDDRSGTDPYFGFTYTVLLPLLAFLPVFISGSIATDSVSEEIERGTLELLRVTPLSPEAILDGKSVALAALAPVQTAVWLGLLAANGVGVAHPWPVLVLVAALATVVVAGGAMLALAVRERRDAQLLYSFGILGLFAATSLLPENPANAVAKLAIGSATPGTWAMVAVSAVAAAALYLLARAVVGRVVADS